MRVNMPFISRGALIAVALLLAMFIWSAWKVNQQAIRVNDQADQIEAIIDAQSPLVFAFQNTGTNGRITFTVTCTRLDGGGNYTCVTKQTEPIVANLTPVSTPTATPERR